MRPPASQGSAPSLVRRAALLYVAMACVALVWNGLRGRGMPLFGGNGLTEAISLGLLTAALTFSLGLAIYALVPAMRRVTREISAVIVSGTGRVSLLFLALLSGVGEEMLFRGAVQAEFGIVVAAIVFGLLHVGPGLRYLWWTAFAVCGGFLYGGLYEVTGGILAPVVAHVLHNAATMLLWKRKFSPDVEGDEL